MQHIIDSLSRLGAESIPTLWIPLLVWTVLSLPVLGLLGLKRDWHPLYHYHIRLALLLALPVGLLCMPFIDVYPFSPLDAPLVSILAYDMLPVQSFSTSVVTSAPTEPVWTMFTWLGVLVVVAGVLGLIALGRLLRDWQALQSWNADLEDRTPLDISAHTRAMHIHRRVDCRLVSTSDPPFTFGWLRPTIVLPAPLHEHPEQLETALTHELIHIRRHDYVLRCIERFLRALFILHPGVPWLCREIDRYREMSCDAEVLMHGKISPRAYASMLMSMLPPNPSRTVLIASMVNVPSHIKSRIQAMKSYSRNRRSRRFAQTIPLLIAGLVLISVAALVSCSDTLIAPEDPSISADLPQSNDVVGQRLERFREQQSGMSQTERADMLIPLMLRVMNGRNSIHGAGYSTPTLEKLSIYRDELLRGNPNPAELEKVDAYIRDEEAKAANQGQTLQILDRHYRTILDALSRIDKPILEQVLLHRQSNDIFNAQSLIKQLGEQYAAGQTSLAKTIEHLEQTVALKASGRDENLNALRKVLGLPPPPPLDPADVAVEMKAAPDQDIRTSVPPTGPRSFTPPPPPSDADVFIVVEEMPKLLGGLEALQQKIQYPSIARDAGIEGNVIVQFVVDKDGKVVDPVVVKGIGGGCDEEALQAVRAAQFTPGRQRGQAVNVKFSLPVRFRLTDAP